MCQLLAMCHYIDSPMHMNMRPQPRPTMFPSVYMNGVNGIGPYCRLFTISNTCTLKVFSDPYGPFGLRRREGE